MQALVTNACFHSNPKEPDTVPCVSNQYTYRKSINTRKILSKGRKTSKKYRSREKQNQTMTNRQTASIAQITSYRPKVRQYPLQAQAPSTPL